MCSQICYDPVFCVMFKLFFDYDDVFLVSFDQPNSLYVKLTCNCMNTPWNRVPLIYFSRIVNMTQNMIRLFL